MSVADVVAAGVARTRPTISFELMPPRNPAAAPKFWDTASRLVAARPDFISVTYGAAGNDRDTARTVVGHLIKSTPVLPIAHLTCVGASRDDVSEVISDFLDEGVRSFLALRGDPPKDQPDWLPAEGSVASSIELVDLLREVEAHRCAASASTALRGAARPLTICVATFPDGNRDAGTTRAQEVTRLLEKQHAGADFAITQLFYEASSYTDFVTEARDAGVTIPILAGILPMTEPRRLHRVEELTGVPAPREVVAALEAAPDDDARHALGIDRTVALAQEVLDAGAPGLHVYTFNKYQAALDLLEGVHLGGGTRVPDLASGPWVSGSTTTTEGHIA
ncbi:methylenetetrahydrofolate reductase (NADPH) [Sediminihabitans luteus]|uniref:Methylenetetrahydrofolate reductase n=1 Tax=Sediminihabitans luteus TaxID=1138585 RepID=A0A2M9CD27_9CELL|nr:methylenetetrahydrofolate reductase [Sediminihabitans luteus]PJJ69248.1 methylenetetrahydrofolate reductase (NADPH) [Sediminihabitans luteus]GII98924.1 methylenetetrahydrofolate reductase [Sediminihabitans luteus]